MYRMAVRQWVIQSTQRERRRNLSYAQVYCVDTIPFETHAKLYTTISRTHRKQCDFYVCMCNLYVY